VTALPDQAMLELPRYVFNRDVH